MALPLLRYRDINLPNALNWYFADDDEETREWAFQFFPQASNIDNFTDTIAQIRQTTFRHQIGKILRIFDQCLVIHKFEGEGDEWFWLQGIATGLSFENGDEPMIEILDEESGVFHRSVDEIEYNHTACAYCLFDDDDYMFSHVPVSDQEIRHHFDHFHGDLDISIDQFFDLYFRLG